MDENVERKRREYEEDDDESDKKGGGSERSYCGSNEEGREETSNTRQSLNLSRQGISEINIPNTIPDLILTRISTLNLANNAFQGGVPNFTRLRQLTHLFLSHNCFDYFSLPSLPAGVLVLDISFNRFVDGIESVSKLYHLEHLIVTGNRLKQLPPLKELTRLQKLCASWNQLTRVPTLPDNMVTIFLSHNAIDNVPDFSNMSKLSEVDLSWNLMEELPVFHHEAKLKLLDISRNNISFFPKDLPMKHLKSFFIEGNFLEINNWQVGSPKEICKPESFIADFVEEADNLKVVKVWFNDFEYFTDIGQLNNYQSLNVSNTSFRYFDGLECCLHLRHLDLSSTPLTSLGQYLHLPLTTLKLSNSKLSTFKSLNLSGLDNLIMLDLSCNNLSEVPQLPLSLVHLDLSNNHLKGIYSPLPNLKWLNCSSNLLKKIPNSLSVYSKTLNYLDVSSNIITALSHLSEFSCLLSLNARNNHIEQVQQNGISTMRQLILSKNYLRSVVSGELFPNLQKLDMSLNLIGGCLLVLSSITLLEELNLANNSVQSLNSLSSLSYLRQLNLSNNQLTHVPSLPQFSLQYLDISGNNIQLLPSEILPISLMELNASHNELRSQPYFEQLSRLAICDISYNSIREVDNDNVAMASKLESLDVGHNPLIKVVLRKMKSLEHISCDHISPEILDIQDLPNLITLNAKFVSVQQRFIVKNLPRLKEINLSCSNIPVKESFIHLPISSLKIVKLQNSDLRQQFEEFSHSTEIIILDLSKNQYSKMPKRIVSHSLELLNISFNAMTVIPDISQAKNLRTFYATHNQFCNMPNLSSNSLISFDFSHNILRGIINLSPLTAVLDLNLSYNHIESTEGIFCMTQLRRLILSHNSLIEFPDISKCHQLQILDLSYNRITSIPDNIINVNKLEILNVSCNYIGVFPISLCNVIWLKKLDLQDNCITIIPCLIYRMVGLRFFRLEGNPLTRPSSEFVRRVGIPGIFAYAMETKDRADSIAETTNVIILGNKGAGKTSVSGIFSHNSLRLDVKAPVATRRVWRPFEFVRFQLMDVEDTQVANHAICNIITEESIAKPYRKVIIAICFDLSTFEPAEFDNVLGKWIERAISAYPNHHLELVATHSDECNEEELNRKTQIVKSQVYKLLRQFTIWTSELENISQTLNAGHSISAASRKNGTGNNIEALSKNKMSQNQSYHLHIVNCRNGQGSNDLAGCWMRHRMETLEGLTNEDNRKENTPTEFLFGEKNHRLSFAMSDVSFESVENAVAYEPPRYRSSSQSKVTPNDDWYIIFTEVKAKRKHTSQLWLYLENVYQDLSKKYSLDKNKFYRAIEANSLCGESLWIQNHLLNHILFHDPDKILNVLGLILQESLPTKNQKHSLFLPGNRHHESDVSSSTFPQSGIINEGSIRSALSKFSVESDQTYAVGGLLQRLHLAFVAAPNVNVEKSEITMNLFTPGSWNARVTPTELRQIWPTDILHDASFNAKATDGSEMMNSSPLRRDIFRHSGQSVRQLRIEFRFGVSDLEQFFSIAAAIINKHVDFTWRRDWSNCVVARVSGGLSGLAGLGRNTAEKGLVRILLHHVTKSDMENEAEYEAVGTSPLRKSQSTSDLTIKSSDDVSPKRFNLAYLSRRGRKTFEKAKRKQISSVVIPQSSTSGSLAASGDPNSSSPPPFPLDASGQNVATEGQHGRSTSKSPTNSIQRRQNRELVKEKIVLVVRGLDHRQMWRVTMRLAQEITAALKLKLPGCPFKTVLACPRTPLSANLNHGNGDSLGIPCPKLLDTIMCAECEVVSLKWIHPPKDVFEDCRRRREIFESRRSIDNVSVVRPFFAICALEDSKTIRRLMTSNASNRCRRSSMAAGVVEVTSTSGLIVPLDFPTEILTLDDLELLYLTSKVVLVFISKCFLKDLRLCHILIHLRTFFDIEQGVPNSTDSNASLSHRQQLKHCGGKVFILCDGETRELAKLFLPNSATLLSIEDDDIEAKINLM